MPASKDPKDVYRSIGVRPAISASGATTAYGGTKLRPEVKQAMNDAAGVMVSLDELNAKAGEILAKYSGAEAGLVSGGSASGLILQAAAVIAGKDPVKMKRLPDTTGMKNEIVIQNVHRFPYDQCYRAVGAKLVGVGDYLRTLPEELEGAITENTAAVAFLDAQFVSPRAMRLDQVVEIAHRHNVPVIVDAANMLPPRANLKKYTAAGADMTIFSGGKGMRGPQGAGVLIGRKDLIEAAYANAAPHQAIGRGMKVTKEEIIGLVQAIGMFVEEDEAAEMNRYRKLAQRAVDALIEIPGLEVSLVHDNIDWLVPTAVVNFTDKWRGPSRDDVMKRMTQGDPPIFLHWLAGPDTLAVDPMNVDDDEMEIVIRRFREELMKAN
ncbi:MAG: aminotransferase class V-fold PLP-dependent enzyme [Chloroflexi bacterium]|nr:aminotransferase class V-fold PLP-dependent enzyme [Chloroflexota bacterium]